ncbi:hypothetical protein D3C80_2061570 [compost metagenome]
MDVHLTPIIGKQAHQVREQIIIANERCQRIRFTVAQVTDRHRLQRDIGVDGR